MGSKSALREGFNMHKRTSGVGVCIVEHYHHGCSFSVNLKCEHMKKEQLKVYDHPPGLLT